MQRELRIPWPERGLSDRRAYQDQPPLTTQHTLNMRNRDPITGRIRGAQRAGLIKYVTPSLGNDFVQDVIDVTYDIDLSTYTVRPSGPAQVWKKINDANDETPAITVTSGGDVYIVAGDQTLEKFNTNGEQVLTAQLPIPSADEYATAVVVGSDGAVYVATERVDNDDQVFQGRVYRYELTLDGEEMLDRIWTYNAGGRVPDIKFDLGTLYVIVNRADRESVLIALESLSSDSPAVKWEKPIPAPSNQLAIDRAGDILVSSPPDDERDDVVIPATCGTKTVDWTPYELGSDVRCWSSADDVVDKAENELVDFWLDRSGNLRSWSTSQNAAGAKYISNAICGKPGLRFDGKINPQSNQYPGLRTFNGNQSALPSTNSPHFISLIFKSRDPAQENDFPLGGYHGVIYEKGGNPINFVGVFNGGDRFYPFTNPYKDNVGPGGSDVRQSRPEGPQYWADFTSSGTPPVTNDQKIVIFTWARDPQFGSATGDREGSFIRINGETLFQYTHLNAASSFGTRLGFRYNPDDQDNPAYADFDLCEVIVVEGEYIWPSDYIAVPSGVGSGQDGIDYGSSSGATPVWEGAPSSGAGPSQIELVEGYLAHKYGVQGVLAAAHPYKSSAPSAASSASSISSGTGPSEDVVNLKSPYGIVSKYGAASGSLKWVYTDAGVGHGLAVGRDEDNDKDYVFTTGPTITIPSSGSSSGYEPTATARRLVDNGFTVSDQSADGAWLLTASRYQSVGDNQRIFADDDLNVYIPIADGTNFLAKIDASATEEWLYSGLAATQRGIVVVPDTLSAINDDTIGEPEFVYLGTRDTGGQGLGVETLYKLRIVDVETSVGAPRGNRALATCEGNIRLMDREAGTVTTPTGGAGALNAGSRIVYSVASNGEVFFVDGQGRAKYDPVANTVSDWQPTGAGSMPNRARLIEAWRGRICLARTDNAPSDIFMSELGNPYGWDRAPAVTNAKQAVSLAAGPVGKVPDIVTSMIPYNDDILIIGCDRSIWMLVGDPMNAVLGAVKGEFGPGEIRQVSGDIGMAFGRPWARDPSGNVYFLSSRGGVYVMQPGSRPQEISGEIRTRLEQIDLEFYTVRMAWSTEDNGLHVFFVPIDVVPASSGSSSGTSSGSLSGLSSGAASGSSSGAPSGQPSGPVQPGGDDVGDPIPTDDNDPAGQAGQGEPLYHFFWELDQNAWWMDQFATADLDPTSVAVFQGDEPEDRRVVIGCADGYVRVWDDAAKNDDASAINAYCRIGPHQPRGITGKYRFDNHQITLAQGQDGATLRTRPGEGDTAEPIGAVRGTHALSAGKNDEIHKAVKGQSVFYDLSNNTAGQRFAVEKMSCRVSPAGKVR